MKKTAITILFLLSLFPVYAQSTYQPTSIDDYLRPAMAYVQAFKELEANIIQLEEHIRSILSQDIDAQMRTTMNEDLRQLVKIDESLHSEGYTAQLNSNYQRIRRQVNTHVVDYNNRVAAENEKAKREQLAREQAERKRQAEEAKKQQEPTNWSGTGFALNSGHVVTNYHVIDGAKNIVVKGVKGDFTTAYHADVVALDKTNDLAILKINDSAFKGFGIVPYRIRSSMVDVGAYVWTLGYPMTAVMGDEIKYTDGKINSKSGIQGDLSVYQISIPIQPGNSGSPVFDKSGYVVGIASSGLNREVFNSENVNYAIKSNYLRMLVESTLSSNIFPNGTALQGISNTEQIKIAKNFVYMIQCTNRASAPMPKPQGGSSTQEEDYRVVYYPTVHNTYANSSHIRIKKITLTKEYTTIEMWWQGVEWCNISPYTYIKVNGRRYDMRKAKGIAFAPEKTYYSKDATLSYFTLYFPAIPNAATEIDLIEPGDSTWKWYGIDISGK